MLFFSLWVRADAAIVIAIVAGFDVAITPAATTAIYEIAIAPAFIATANAVVVAQIVCVCVCVRVEAPWDNLNSEAWQF